MIKIWNVYHAPIARYGPELKIIQIEFELEIELGPKFFFWFKKYPIRSIYGINF